jgi:polyphosphate kinase
MSPTQIKPKLLRLIEKEASYGKDGHIILKANSLVEQNIIKALYKASMAGCKIDLIIRGICCLRPGIEGVSENITVHSIIGKYLEHPRIYWFKHAKVRAYISSADLMPRNLDRRIELMVPIEAEELESRLHKILQTQIADNTHRYILLPNRDYIRITPNGEEEIDSQEIFEKYVTKISKLQNKKSSKQLSKLTKKMLKD